jgi:hypothetical protein
MTQAEISLFNKSDEVIYHYKWADPQFLNMSIGLEIPPGAVAGSARNIGCHDEFNTPLVSKAQLTSMKFSSLASTSSGDGEMFYKQVEGDALQGADQKDVIVIIENHEDHDLTTQWPGTPADVIDTLPRYRKEVGRVRFKCAENKSIIVNSQNYDTSGNIVSLNAADLATVTWVDVPASSPFGLLKRIVCPSAEATK